MAPPPRTDNNDLNDGGDYFFSSYIHRRNHHFEDQPRHLPTGQQVVPYDESSKLDPAAGRTRAKTTKKERWSPSSSSSSTSSSSSSSIQPRAEISFPLHWEQDKLLWKRRQSRITATTTLPLYQSQDALFDDHTADNDPKKNAANTILPRFDGGRQEIVCNVSLTTMQQEFRDAALLGSCQLRATHYHHQKGSSSNNDRAKQQSKKKTSLVLSVHRRGRPSDVVTFAAEQVGQSYAISAVTVLWPYPSHNNHNNNNNNKFSYNNIDSSNSNKYFSNFRIAAHCDWQVPHHGRQQFGVVKIRPDIRVAATAPSAGISIIVHDSPTFALSKSSSRRRSPPALPLWHVRCGCIRDDNTGWWKPTIRLHWTFPFVGSFNWTYGGSSSSSTMIQYEASWKTKTHANSSLQMSVTTADILHSAVCRWMIAYTLSDVTIRIPILIAAASSGWQRHLLYWGLTSAISHLVHITVQDMFGRTNNNNDNQRRPKKHVTSSRNSTDEQPSGQNNGRGRRRQTALLQQHFMQRQATLRYRDEEQKRDGGLLIETATYYRYGTVQKFDVTIPLRFWVTDSKLELFAESKRSLMLGFCNLAAEGEDDDGDDDNEEQQQANKSTWSKRFKVAVRRLLLAPTTIIRDESAASAQRATAAARPQSGVEQRMVLEICYRYQGTRYSITVGDEEHLVLPSSRATEMTG
jgi:hypothetical protein